MSGNLVAAVPLTEVMGVTGTPEERLWAMLAHLLVFIVLIVSCSAPLIQFLPPAVIYFAYRDRSQFVAFHALQSLLFQLLISLLSFLFIAVTVITCGLALLVLAPAIVVLWIVELVFIVLASLRSYNGELYEYPFAGQWARNILGI